MSTGHLEKHDAPILSRIARGDETAIEDCISTYGNLIWALAKKLTPRPEDAEDAVQEVFMAIWQNAARYEPEKSAEITFIALLARRRLIDRLRKTYRQPVVHSIDESVETRPNVFEAAVNRKIEAEQAVKAMSDLRPQQRQMLMLNIYAGMSHGEIAEQTGLPLGTVKTHIRRGFKRVREALGYQNVQSPGAVTA